MIVPVIGEKLFYFKCFAGGQAHGRKVKLEAKVIGVQKCRPSMMKHVRIEFEFNGVIIKRTVSLESVEKIQ